MECVAIVISLVGVCVAVWAAISSSQSAQKQIAEVHRVSVKASEEAQKQIAAITQLLDVFMIANTPQILETKHKYEESLTDLVGKIKIAETEMKVIRHPFGFSNRADEMMYEQEQIEQEIQIDNWHKEKDRIETIINAIQQFLDKRN